MIRFEQIQLLERKIDKAVELINLLKKENHTLKNAIQKSQVRMNELENLLEQFKGEQIKIEEGLINALTKLDQLEDEVSDTSENSSITDDNSTEKSDSSIETDDTETESSEYTSDSEESDLTGDQEINDNDPPEKEIELDIF